MCRNGVDHKFYGKSQTFQNVRFREELFGVLRNSVLEISLNMSVRPTKRPCLEKFCARNFFCVTHPLVDYD